MRKSTFNPRLIALDADGVMLDYHDAYAEAWGKAFGCRPEIVDPNAYWAIDRYGLRSLEGPELAHFRSFFDDDFWASLRALPGAVEAANRLAGAGWELACVSAIRPQHVAARQANLAKLGFPIARVFGAHGDHGLRSPKADILSELMPAAFVDDYLPYLRGVPASIHRALIDREPTGSPNHGPELSLASSTHSSLLDFSKFWLDPDGGNIF